MTDTSKIPNDLPTMVKQTITGHPGYPDFTAWCESQQIHPYPIYFLIWQASREAVEVELPRFDDYPASMEHDMRESLRAAIEAQGLKVAP